MVIEAYAAKGLFIDTRDFESWDGSSIFGKHLGAADNESGPQ